MQFAVAIGFVLTTATMSVGSTPMYVRGVELYPDANPYHSPEALRALSRLLVDVPETQWVQFRFFFDQESMTSSTISDGDRQLDAIRSLTRRARQGGREVSWIVHLLVDGGRAWAALVAPEDRSQWFRSYGRLMQGYARVAQHENVSLLTIFNEYTSLLEETSSWRRIIREIRSVYRGWIAVKLNSWWDLRDWHRILSSDWLADVDVIGLAPYFDLVNKPRATLAEMRRGWRASRHGHDIVYQLATISRRFGKPIVFLEVGYRSIEGAAIEPWNSAARVPADTGRPVQDLREQATAAQSVFDIFCDHASWWRGSVWFYWPTAVTTPPDDRGWAILGKPVVQTIRNGFQIRCSEEVG
ncbi:MAG: hypothetical protein QN163_06355 [Armatimonadota bacterium]|nr:hypothetical protein [Armatimonadota bacterium]MDR5697861.1 hypothetical protein [Armatimonadota bacterium]